MAELTAGPGTQVTLHFALRLENGDLVDSNFEAQPAVFVVGDGNLLPGFEEAVCGLMAGDRTIINVPPEKAFGQPNPNNVQQVPRESFSADFELSIGLVVGFSDAAGAENPAVITDFDDDSVTVDFNHPLAGKSILFEVQIIEVLPAITH